MGGNREYKNSLFTTLFSDPEQLRELYNAIAGTDYGADTPIEINTLADILTGGKKGCMSGSLTAAPRTARRC